MLHLGFIQFLLAAELWQLLAGGAILGGLAWSASSLMKNLKDVAKEAIIPGAVIYLVILLVSAKKKD